MASQPTSISPGAVWAFALQPREFVVQRVNRLWNTRLDFFPKSQGVAFVPDRKPLHRKYRLLELRPLSRQLIAAT